MRKCIELVHLIDPFRSENSRRSSIYMPMVSVSFPFFTPALCRLYSKESGNYRCAAGGGFYVYDEVEEIHI
jgi:hypothetical protein